MDVIKTVSQTLDTDDSTAMAVLVAIGIVVASILLLVLIFRKSRKAKDTVLLLGLSDSGKTQIFTKIVSGSDDVATFTSMKENTFPGLAIRKNGPTVDLIDVPGSDKLRKRIADVHFNQGGIRGVVFTVDSSTFTKTAKDVAEYLYDILCDAPKNLPVLIACHKQDLSMAKSPQIVKMGLEKEFGLLNRSRSAALDSTDGAHSHVLTSSSQFDWSDISQKVTFRESSTKSEEGLEEMKSWIISLK